MDNEFIITGDPKHAIGFAALRLHFISFHNGKAMMDKGIGFLMNRKGNFFMGIRFNQEVQL